MENIEISSFFEEKIKKGGLVYLCSRLVVYLLPFILRAALLVSDCIVWPQCCYN